MPPDLYKLPGNPGNAFRWYSRGYLSHLDGLSARIQTLEKTTRKRLDRLAALKASLFAAAFRGATVL